MGAGPGRAAADLGLLQQQQHGDVTMAPYPFQENLANHVSLIISDVHFTELQEVDIRADTSRQDLKAV